MAKCGQCFQETGSTNSLCPDCKRQNARLEGEKKIASQLLSDQRQASQNQYESQQKLSENNARAAENQARESREASREQQEANERLTQRNEQIARHQIAEQERIAREQIENQKELFKESHLNVFKIKLVDCAILFGEDKKKAGTTAEILLTNNDIKDNLEFFWNDIRGCKGLKNVFFKNFLEEYKHCFKNCNVFKNNVLDETEYEKLSTKFWNELGNKVPNRQSIWTLAHTLKEKKFFKYSEAFWRIILDLSIKEVPNSDDPSKCFDLIIDCIRKSGETRYSETLSLLKEYGSKYPFLKDRLKYNTACYSALTGDIKQAKQIIKSVFDASSDVIKDISYALQDRDLVSIRPYIEEIKKKQEEKKALQERENKKKYQAEKERKLAQTKANNKENARRKKIANIKQFFTRAFFWTFHLIDLCIISYLVMFGAKGMISSTPNIKLYIILAAIVSVIVTKLLYNLFSELELDLRWNDTPTFSIFLLLPISSLIKTFFAYIMMFCLGIGSTIIFCIIRNLLHK